MALVLLSLVLHVQDPEYPKACSHESLVLCFSIYVSHSDFLSNPALRRITEEWSDNSLLSCWGYCYPVLCRTAPQALNAVILLAPPNMNKGAGFPLLKQIYTWRCSRPSCLDLSF